MELDLDRATLPVLAEHSYNRLGERMTMIYEGEEFTNTHFTDRGRILQGAFAELGAKRGTSIAVCMTNHPAVLYTFGGVFRTGATAVPVMFQLSAAELNFVLSDTGAIGIVTDSTLLFKVREAVKGLDHVKWVAVLDGKDDEKAETREIALATLLAGSPIETLPKITPEDVALMLFTSGTTGKPKGVMLTHSNMIAAARCGLEAAEYDTWDGPRNGVLALPLAHMFGIGLMNGGHLIPEHVAGGYSVLMKWFEPEGFMRHIHEHKAKTFAAVPTMLSLILNHPKNDQYDLSSLEEILVGAAPLPEPLAREFMKKYGCFLREGYGMTENTAIATINRASWGYKPGSAGKGFSSNEIAIFGADDKPVAVGEKGEIVAKGPTVMKGYHNRPEATAEAMTGGWLHTGDIGYLDEEGWLFVVDRKKDMILRGGENIYPAELEDVIYKHPAVAEAAVVGTPDDVYGEKVVACVVVKDDCELGEGELIEFMRKYVTKFKCPQEVLFLEALPKTGIGKILRRELRDQVASGMKA